MRRTEILVLMNATRQAASAYGNAGKARAKQRGFRPVSEMIDRRRAGSEWRSSKVKTYYLTMEELERYKRL
jgi:hypothetical protein